MLGNKIDVLGSVFNPLGFGCPVWLCFADGGGSGDDGNPEADNADGSGKKPDGSSDPKNKDPFAIFPDQASFDARIKREGRAQIEALAKEMGFDDAAAMQAAAKAQREAGEKAKTELEKEREARERAEEEKALAIEKANNRLIDAEIKVLAAAAGFADITDAVALVDRTEISVDEEGKVTGVKEAVEALAKAKPHLLGKSPGTGGIGGSSNPGDDKGGGDDDGTFGAALGKRQAEQLGKQQDSQKHYFGE